MNTGYCISTVCLFFEKPARDWRAKCTSKNDSTTNLMILIYVFRVNEIRTTNCALRTRVSTH